jgi:GT2 family glycosyltransferase
MAVHDTVENGRTAYTGQTITSLLRTVDFSKHKLFISDNGSCGATHDVYEDAMKLFPVGSLHVEYNEENLGTARAVNKGLKAREAWEKAIKIDNDVVVNHPQGWVERMEDVIARMPQVGILGLKRRDLQESTYSINPEQRSRLLEVKHETGQRWEVVEEAKMIMGTCTMFNPELLKKIGGLYQMNGLYGFDDCLACVRSSVAGFINCFIHGIDLEHIDPGGTEYTAWKAKHAGEMIGRYSEEEAAFRNGVKGVFVEL